MATLLRALDDLIAKGMDIAIRILTDQGYVTMKAKALCMSDNPSITFCRRAS
jgi:hypothetical protein